MKKIVQKKKNQLVWVIFLPIVLTIIGTFFVFGASAVRSFQESGDSLYYFRLQVIWLLIGIITMFFFSWFNYHRLYYWAFLLMSATIVLLFLVLIPGFGSHVGGARRWINLGFFNLQPTELAKLATLIYLCSWFINRERKRFFSFLIFIGLLMFLIFLQPDMGTASIIFLMGIGIYFLVGIELHYLLFLFPAALGIGYWLIKTSPYRFKRLLAFFNPALDPLGITYHINQIVISITNGGFFGQGFGASKQKYLFLPEAHTDSIFAIISEEVGLFGSLLLIGIFLLLIYFIYKVTINASDRYGRLLAGGIFLFFNLQVCINLASMVNLIPLTGVPLPFISYGGSNLLVSFAFIGILINIGRQSKIYHK